VVDLQEQPLSDEEMAEIKDVLDCSRPARFILWKGDDPAQAKTSGSGVDVHEPLPR
jgi:hypothetical protein